MKVYCSECKNLLNFETRTECKASEVRGADYTDKNRVTYGSNADHPTNKNRNGDCNDYTPTSFFRKIINNF